ALLAGISLTSWQALRASRAEWAQSRLRIQAESGERKARAESERAESTAANLKNTLSSAHFTHAVNLIEKGSYSEALPFLVSSLSENPVNDAAATRLFTLLTYHWVLPAATLDLDPAHFYEARFDQTGRKVILRHDIDDQINWEAYEAGTLRPLDPQKVTQR